VFLNESSEDASRSEIGIGHGRKNPTLPRPPAPQVKVKIEFFGWVGRTYIGLAHFAKMILKIILIGL